MNELSADARAVIDAALSSEQPPFAPKTRIHEALARRIAALPTPGLPAPAVPAVGIVAKAAIAAFSITVGAGGLAFWHSRDAAERIEPGSASQHDEVRLAAVPELPAAAPEPPRPASPVRHPPRPRVATAAAAPAIAAPASVPEVELPTAEDNLSRELALVSSAQDALRARDPARALSLLEQHEAVFPNGVLSPERRAARVFALCALGRGAQARQEAAQFLAEAPRSPLAGRVRAACDATPP